MTENDWEILETRIAGTKTVLKVSAAPHRKPVAGQYFHVFAPELNEVAAIPLFLVEVDGTSWDLTGEIPQCWNPGTRLSWHGPLGRGFEMPSKVQRAAFVPWADQGLYLLPVVQQALDGQAAVVWYSHQVPEWLPSSVEVLPPEFIPEGTHWAEYVAGVCPNREWPAMVEMLGSCIHSNSGCKVEVLLQTPLLCGGMGECGICSVKTRDGWKFACTDGPVFDLGQLELKS